MKLSPRLALGLGASALAVAAMLKFMATGLPTLAPDVAYTRLDGSSAHTGALKGKVVLVKFWATTCRPCIEQMPQLVATHQKYHKQGFETLAVAMSYDPPAQVINFANSRQLPFTVIIDNVGSLARSFGEVQVTPTSFLINKSGEIVQRDVGEANFATLHRLIDELLLER